MKEFVFLGIVLALALPAEFVLGASVSAEPERRDITSPMQFAQSDGSAEPLQSPGDDGLPAPVPANPADLTEPMAAPPVAMSAPPGFSSYAGAPLTVEDLMGATVFDRDDVAIAAITDFVLDGAGAISAVILDPAIEDGAPNAVPMPPVTVPFGELQVFDNGETLRVYLVKTRDEVFGAPEQAA